MNITIYNIDFIDKELIKKYKNPIKYKEYFNDLVEQFEEQDFFKPKEFKKFKSVFDLRIYMNENKNENYLINGEIDEVIDALSDMEDLDL